MKTQRQFNFKVKESDIQKECLHLLQILENQRKIYFIRSVRDLIYVFQNLE